MFIAQLIAIDTHYGMRLEWEKSPASDFSHYSIHMTTTGNRDYEWLADTTDTSYFLPNLVGGQSYYFVVYAHDKNGNRSIASDEVILTMA